MFKCKLHYFVYVEKGMLQIYGVLELEFFFFFLKSKLQKKRRETKSQIQELNPSDYDFATKQ